MRDENEIKKNLEQTYRYRLELRIKRMMRRSCRNCVSGHEEVISAGDLGEIRRWVCSEGRKCRGESCAGFSCRNTPDSITAGMLRDIGDPSVCGAKEPRIAALMWTLQNPGQACGGMSVPEAKLLDKIAGRDALAGISDEAPAETPAGAQASPAGQEPARGSEHVVIAAQEECGPEHPHGPGEGCPLSQESADGGQDAEKADGRLPFLDCAISWVRGKSLKAAGRVMMFLAGVPW